jgi:hypothetical protein
VYLQAVNPRRCQALYVFQPAEGVWHRINGHVLFVLVLNVFTVGGLEGFFPTLPTGVWKPWMSADYFREDFSLSCIRKISVEFPRQRQPVFAVKHAIPVWRGIRPGTRIAEEVSIKFTIAWR